MPLLHYHNLFHAGIVFFPFLYHNPHNCSGRVSQEETKQGSQGETPVLAVPFGKKVATSLSQSYHDSVSVHVFELLKVAYLKVTHVLNFHLFSLFYSKK